MEHLIPYSYANSSWLENVWLAWMDGWSNWIGRIHHKQEIIIFFMEGWLDFPDNFRWFRSLRNLECLSC